MTKSEIKVPSLEQVKQFREGLDTPAGVFGPFMITADPAFVEAAGYAGYDFVLLDMEHGPGTFENLQNLIRAANVAGVSRRQAEGKHHLHPDGGRRYP